MADRVNKAALLAAMKPKMQPAPVDGFGDVLIRQLSVAEVQAIRADIKKSANVDSDQFGLRLVLVSVANDDGTSVFSEDDLAALNASSNSAVDKLVSKALEVNGFRKAEDTKNSAEAPSAGSVSV